MTTTTDTRPDALVLVDVRDGVAALKLNRPRQFNALSAALIADLQAALDLIAANPGVRVIVLAGNGRGFC